MSLHLDFETATSRELKSVGGWIYSQAPDLQIPCLAYSFGNEPVKVAYHYELLPRQLPADLTEYLLNNWGEIRAWNASFEAAILLNHFGFDLPAERFVCVMEKALYAGLPAALGDCGDALGVAIVKDKTMRSEVLRMARPRGYTPAGVARWWHEEAPERLERLGAYCARDVEAEREIDAVLHELPEREREISLLHRRAEFTGVRLDLNLIQKMVDLAEDAILAANERAQEITAGAVKSPGTNSASVLKWAGRGYPFDSLAADRVQEALKTDLDPEIREILELRVATSKSSTKKLYSMMNTADRDGAAHGLIQYYGTKTGRSSGRLWQPQNLPRGVIKNPNDAINSILRGADRRALKGLYGDPLGVISSCIRGAIIPREGHKFICFDLSAIEARVLAWLADQKDILQAFKQKEDIYVFTARKMGLSSRAQGKVAVLGLGYSMGVNKFIDFAAASGLMLDEAEAQSIVHGWRRANNKIVELWHSTERVVREAIAEHEAAFGKRTVRMKINDLLSVTINNAGKKKDGPALLTIELPVGRRLFYRNIGIDTESDTGRDVIAFDGVSQTTRRWERQRTYSGKLVENMTQAVARDVIFSHALEVEARGFGRVLLSIHDELLIECEEGRIDACLDGVREIMNAAPEWCRSLPMAAAGGVLDRYEK